ncbi:PREDICTED: uncharacterized protein KIAA1586-like [Thamnophis sirtalis]|uniref:Uncharacterized protein KIAA1586-like n=1 Tax=Thamnophis sirtalis TaxID=35019 RepID=A0A6I9XXL4_9SAUR|nr:PREDICTED: uncharacterized protein KIAA1586-like [Thamnophis sirtalis]
MTKGKMNGKYLRTSKVFNTVYSLAKKCKSFSDIQKEIEVQIKNGLDMGIGLQSRKTVVKIVDFIAKAIKKAIFTKIVENNLNISLIIDKVSTISSKPVIIVFLKVEDSVTSPTIFVELIELEKQDADTICSAVMESLNNVGLAKNYLEKNLIGFCSDGTCGLLGIKSGVTTRIEKEFPNIIIWHGLNHRLHLGLDDLMKEIKLVNNFKTFIDKIHTIFHQSNKDQIEPTKISEQLGVELIKIGRVLEPWAACTLRSILAVWHAFPVLEDYFYSNEKYLGMATRLENIYVITDLALMIDILNEISFLSNALQARDIDIIKAEKLMIRSIKAFQVLGKEMGAYEKKVDELITSETFKNIKFVENQRFVRLPREILLENIVMSLEKILMDCEYLNASCNQFKDSNILQILKFLDPDYWNTEEVCVPWYDGECQLYKFNNIFNHKIDINDYRDFVEIELNISWRRTIPESVQRAKNIIRTIVVSSAEVESIFSKINIICSGKRSRLTVSNISNMMTISLIGQPPKEWDPTPTVKRWLRKNHRANNARIRAKKIAS